MSNAKVVKVVPVELQGLHKKILTAYLGPVTRSFQGFTASSGTNTNSIQINIVTPSKNVVVRKNLMVYYSLAVAFTGTPIGPGPYTLFQTTTGDAPRACPIAQNVTGCAASIGDGSVQTQDSGQYWDAISRYFMTIQERNNNMSTFPSYPDPLGAGFNTIGAANPGTYNAFTGTAKDPFLNGDQGRDHRGDYPFYLNPQNFATNVAGQTQTAYFISCEPLLGQSVFSQSSTSLAAGFWGVQNISLSIQLKSPLNVWSHDITKLSGLTYATSFYSAPVALCEFWTPPKNLMPRLPLYYKMSKLTQCPQLATAAIASGATFDVIFNNQQVSSVPNAIYMWCKPVDGQRLGVANENAGTIYAMDNYAGAPRVAFSSTTGPSNVSGLVKITFDNAPAQLSDMNVEQLYNMCVSNGLVNTSMAEWMEFGCVYKIFPGKDIYMDPTHVAGSSGNFNMSIQAKFQNNYSQAVAFTPYLLLVQDGYFCIGERGNTVEVGEITGPKLAEAQVAIPEKPETTGEGLYGTIAGTAAALMIPGAQFFAPELMALGSVAEDKLRGGGWKGDAMYMDSAKRIKRKGEYSLH